MSFSECCRNASISNISNPGSAGTFFEAFLNNLAAPNSSFRVSSPPPFMVSTTSSFPLNGVEADGDSVVYEMFTPRSPAGPAGSSMPVTYSNGYSASQPLGWGSSVVINQATQSLNTIIPVTGLNSLAMRVRDYRGGVLVGYTEFDWTIGAVGGTVVTIPRPVSVLATNTCPGQSHTLSVVFQDSTSTDTVTTSVVSNSLNIPVTMSGGTGVGSATAVLNWTTPATLDPAVTKYYTIRLKVRDQHCPRPGIAWYDVLVRTAPCVADTVWPGDADGDNIVNLYDPLAIAVAHGKTGPSRPGANLAWTAQPGPAWGTSFLNGVNHKHADCDGNGTVDDTDLAAVSLNYGQTHPRPGGEEAPAKTAGLPDLYFDLTGVAGHAGSMVSVPIKLGTTGSTMSNLYGLSTRIQIAGMTPSTAPTIAYPANWLGTVSNTLRFAKPVMNNTSVDWSYARTTGTATSGDGTLAQLEVAIPATTPVGTQMILRFFQPRLISADGMEITAYNVVYDTLTIQAPTGITNASSAVQNASVVPNPSDQHALLQVHTSKAQTIHLSITDAVGRVTWTRSIFINGGSASVSLSEVEVPAGIYFVRVQPADGSAGKVVKWVRE